MSNVSDRLRRAQLAKIHIAKKDLLLDEERYLAILWTCGRVRSSKDLDTHGRLAVIEHMKSLGFVTKKAAASFEGRPSNVDSNPQIRKIEALLADNKLSWNYAHGMAKKMFKRDRVQLCDPQQLRSLIAALSIHAKRHSGEARTHASDWFADDAAFRQLCGDAHSLARSEKAQEFAHQMLTAANASGLKTPITEAQLKWLCDLADAVLPLRLNTQEGVL